jgi:nitronate monooxygenase
MGIDRKEYPTIIQGGMGAGVSSWRLARSVSLTGQLGVVSGTALNLIMARRLQQGDPGGHMRRALQHFPLPEVAARIVDRYFVAGGKPADKPFKAVPISSFPLSRDFEEMTVAANFAEVFLAKEGHDGLVGVNYLEKIQLPTLPSIYGAMLAGIDFILMGAGIPKSIPGVLDLFGQGKPAQLKIDVKDAPRDAEYCVHFDPQAFLGQEPPLLLRPKFLAIISSATLGAVLAKRSNGRVDGFVVEGPTAGGHNAPPRGPLQLNSLGEPIYTERDEADIPALVALNLPFWLAGSYAEPHRVAEALAAGAHGVQVGTAFAYCEESDLYTELKRTVLEKTCLEGVQVFTDPVASPTGFPFKVVRLEGTLTEDECYRERDRICDLAYLRHGYYAPDGSVGWRCPAEPVADYLRKGGCEADTEGRKCLCNALLANLGLGQVRGGSVREKPLVTSGMDAQNLARFLGRKELSYSAREVVDYLLSGLPQPEPALTAVTVG